VQAEEEIMAKHPSTIKEISRDGKAGKFTDHKSDARAGVIRDRESNGSSADAKMLRAWKTISENRGVAKNSRSK